MTDEPHKPVLQDHVKVKRKLVSPFLHQLGGKLSIYSWTRQLVPEAIWLGLVIDRCGYEAARIHCRALGQACCAVVNRSDALFIKFSAFAELSDVEKRSAMTALGQSACAAIGESLAPLTAVMPDHPLAFLLPATNALDNVTQFPELLREFYDRNSRAAVLSSALGYELGIDQGKFHVAEHLVEGLIAGFKVIGRYPETDEARRAAGYFRAAMPQLFMAMDLEGRGFANDPPWISVFWGHISGYGPCLLPHTLEDEGANSEDPLEQFVFDYRNAVRADLRSRLEHWPLDLKEIEVFEVVTALLCRQATLVMEMASSPAVWSPHTAPILLRAMADVFINLAWILKDPGPRARRYVEDGQGAIKLQIAHQKRAIEAASDPGEAERMSQMIELWSDWLASQRMEVFVEVNLGSWSGLNARKMAEEAGFLDFYNFVYQPFSAAVHSNWAHVSMNNTVFCQNPAHRGHRGALVVTGPIDLEWLYLASKYLSKTFDHFDKVRGLSLPHTAFDLVVNQSFDDAEQ